MGFGKYILTFAFSLITIDMAFAGAEQRFALQSNLDHVWTMIAAGLVFFMQAGFLLLESGMVRSKNSINVAQKNITDFILSTMVFGAVGFMFMFGKSTHGFFGWDSELFLFDKISDWAFTFFVFQLVFCGTAATILSGASAERIKLEGYMMIAILLGLVIYPISGHWAWGNLLNDTNEPFLASMGFLDFAGSTVVHSVGAWVALACIVIVGARIGRYDEEGKPIHIQGHSAVLATLGCIILWIGWIGFNGGSTTAGTSSFAVIIANTMVAGAAGGVVQMLLGKYYSGVYRPDFSINGVLSGLVGITAGCDAVTIWNALIIGASASAIAYYGQKMLDHFKLDDAIGAIPVHGFAGAWGTIILALLANEDKLAAGSRIEQLGVQVLGVVVVFVWAFGVTYIFLKVIDSIWKTFPGGGFRVSEEDEIEGLNVTEHGATLGSGKLLRSMEKLASGELNLSDRIKVEHGDETADIAISFNKVLDKFEQMELEQRERAEEEAKRAEEEREKAKKQIDVVEEVKSVAQKCAQGDFTSRVPTDDLDGFLLELAQSINTINETSDKGLSEIRSSLQAIAVGDLTKEISGEYEGMFLEIKQSFNNTLERLVNIIGDITDVASAAGVGDFSRRISIDEKEGFMLELANGINTINEISDRGLSEIRNSVQAIAKGDLSQEITGIYEGMFDEIKQSFNNTLEQLNTIINEATASAAAAGRGNFTSHIDVHGKEGFMLELAQGINTINDVSNEGLTEVKNIMAALSEGDLTCKVSGEYQGLFDEIKQALNITIDKLSNTTQQILQTSNFVADSANEISEGSSNISRHTEAQSHNLRQTASSMEQVATTVQQNAQNASEANNIVGNAKEAAEDGGKVVNNAVEAMERIEKSSRKIGDITSVIDEIAFQINLLAINASVEAARAGEAGKGFEVVAAEVSKLAQRSASAAKDIANLIETSGKEVRQGAELVKDTGGSLEEIMSSVTNLANIINEISTSSNEQSLEIANIKSSVDDVNNMTQQNTTLVEESTSSAQAMANQAKQLNNLIAFFRTNKSGGNKHQSTLAA